MAVAQAFNPSTREAKASLVVYREREREFQDSQDYTKKILSQHTHTHIHKEKERRKERLERGGT